MAADDSRLRTTQEMLTDCGDTEERKGELEAHSAQKGCTESRGSRREALCSLCWQGALPPGEHLQGVYAAEWAGPTQGCLRPKSSHRGRAQRAAGWKEKAA